ncbi:small multi-drug export protein [Mesobacillus harenae]|uniref:small multi-drug export protein n=1 Tax=Mesobacillus harenae TaxID=2213203 RepID=UPI00158013EC|nr:small multi-drug export protein [Mesobacillus harenae]
MSWFLAIWEYVFVFILAAIPWIEIAAVIPLSIINEMNAFSVGLLAFIGNLSTVYLLVIFFEKYQEWRVRKKGKPSKKQARGEKVWRKYGLPGLAFLGPLVIGSHIAAIVGLALGAKKRPTLLWMTISLAVWTLVFTLTSVYAIELLGFPR